MPIKVSDKTKNIYIDLTQVPGVQGKNYNIFVFKRRIKDFCKLFSNIYEKVSEHSDFKPLCEKLRKEQDWKIGKPEHLSNYKRDDKKCFLELSVDELSALKDMVYAYKSKLGGGTLVAEDSEVKRNSTIKSIINKVLKHGNEKKDDGIEKRKLKSELDVANKIRRDADQKKYKALLEKNFKEYDKKINDESKRTLDQLNPLLKPEDRIKYEEMVYNSSADNAVNQKNRAVLDLMRRKKIKCQQNKNDYGEEAFKKITEIFDRWINTVGIKIQQGINVYGQIEQLMEDGYKIISLLGAGGNATVVKFINEKGKERALKIFNKVNSGTEAYNDEVDAIKSMYERLTDNSSSFRKNKSTNKMKKSFNIPKVHSDGKLQMKLANKVLDSDEFINRGGKKSGLPIGFFKKLARQILKALKQLHDKGMVHSDIKPDNIHRMSDGRFKIADMGTVTPAVSGEAISGTRSYMHDDFSARVSAVLKQKNDVYALGCSLLDILCGKRVGKYAGFSQSAVLNEVSPKFTDESMNKQNISELLKFISKLCAKKLDDVPTATEALKDPFVQKIAK